MANKALRSKVQILVRGLKEIIGDGRCNWMHGTTSYTCPVCVAKRIMAEAEALESKRGKQEPEAVTPTGPVEAIKAAFTCLRCGVGMSRAGVCNDCLDKAPGSSDITPEEKIQIEEIRLAPDIKRLEARARDAKALAARVSAEVKTLAVCSH